MVGDDPDGNGPKVAPQTTYVYDGVGNRTKETVAIDSGSSRVMQYQYDHGDVKSEIAPDLAPPELNTTQLGRDANRRPQP